MHLSLSRWQRSPPFSDAAAIARGPVDPSPPPSIELLPPDSFAREARFSAHFRHVECRDLAPHPVARCFSFR
jgi:hypothetical protein